MCTRAWIIGADGQGRDAGSISELRDALGVEPVYCDGYAEIVGESCLCPVDFARTAALAGMIAVIDDCGDYELRRG